MTRGSGDRGESELPAVPPGRGGHEVAGRKCISVIGIDRYRRWMPLNNAVNDARGVLAAFERLGFVSITQPLLDDAATFDAIRCLPGSLRPELDGNDTLVVFFAGHGYTASPQFSDGLHVSKGYLIPVDADRAHRDHADDPDHTWQRVEHWLSAIAELPPRNVLVILDSCYSGIALGRAIQYRGMGVREEQDPYHQRRGRWVLASALDNQRAMDGGPVAGHSVFTGHLIEALRCGENTPYHGSLEVSVSEVAAYVCRRVREHSGRKQVPELGWLDFHDFGDLVFSFAQPHTTSSPQPWAAPAEPVRSTPAHRGRRPVIVSSPAPRPSATCQVRSRPLEEAATSPVVVRQRELAELPDRTEGWALDPELAAALERHNEERRRGANVLTVVAGDALAAQTSWGTWAARHGYLTLATQSVGLDAVVSDLLAQTPWLRCVPAARQRLATAAGIDIQEVDAAIDARSMSERRTWLDDVAGHDPHARVSGWLLSSLRRPVACVPDLSSAPVRHGDLLAIACDLASPTAVLMFHPAADQQWMERAVCSAAELIERMRGHSIAVTVPDEIATRVLAERRRGAAWTMARQGLVRVASRARRTPGRARHSTARVLFDALARDPRTRDRFELDGKIRTAQGPVIDVALVAHGSRIAVELDGWYQFHDPEGYQRDRVQDMRLQRAGYFVLRFACEDVDDRLASTVEQLAVALASRRAVRAFP